MPLSLAEFKQKTAGRDLYLRGARQLGFSVLKALHREGFAVKAFLDASRDLIGSRAGGLPVLAPEALDGRPRGGYFIIIAAAFFYTEIAEEYRAAGLVEGQDFLIATDLVAMEYMIDVSGSCNLRCPSCPRGNFSPQPRAGFMSPEYFTRVLDKILAEDPLVGAVALYQWGEPLLNKDLAAIIRLAHDRGVLSAISSNLNIRRDFSDVVKARPAWFRVSTSGWEKNYEQTHRGGDWRLLTANLRKLRDLAAEHAPDMTIEVFYHIYKDRRDDYRRMKELCDSLGLTLRLRHAALAPLDTIADIIHGRPVNSSVQLTRELQSLSVEDCMALAREQKDLPCPYARYQWITWDGLAPLCEEWFHPDLLVSPRPFLEIPLAEIIAARENSPHCRACRQEGIHRCFVVYGDEKLIEARQSLGAAR